MNKETFLRLVPTQTYNKNQEKSIIFLQDLQSKVVIGTQKLTKIERTTKSIPKHTVRIY